MRLAISAYHWKPISSLQHPMVKHLVRIREEKSYRYSKGTVVIHGKNMIKDVLHKERRKIGAAHSAKRILVTEEYRSQLDEMKDNLDVDWNKIEKYQVTPEVIRKASGVAGEAEGLLVEMEMPKSAAMDSQLEVFPPVESGKKGLILALDGVSDPGNMGNLLRSCLALDFHAAFIGPNSVDPFNDKSVRAAKGATFLLPLMYSQKVSWKELAKVVQGEKRKWTVLVGDAAGEPIHNVLQNKELLRGSDGFILVLGSESKGISQEFINEFNKRIEVCVPISSQFDSLNVSAAGAILMDHIRSVNTMNERH